MSWKDKYEQIMTLNDGELAILGVHVSKEEALQMIEDYNYDDKEEYINHKITHAYAKFGFVSFEGERVNGFTVKDQYTKGCIKITILDDFEYIKNRWEKKHLEGEE